MAMDEQRDADAREAYLAVARGYPASDQAANARFNAAILAYATGRLKVAAAELDTLVMLYPRSSDASAAMYWSARAHATLRDSAGARERGEELLGRDPTSFYASLGAVPMSEWTEQRVTGPALHALAERWRGTLVR